MIILFKDTLKVRLKNLRSILSWTENVFPLWRVTISSSRLLFKIFFFPFHFLCMAIALIQLSLCCCHPNSLECQWTNISLHKQAGPMLRRRTNGCMVQHRLHIQNISGPISDWDLGSGTVAGSHSHSRWTHNLTQHTAAFYALEWFTQLHPRVRIIRGRAWLLFSGPPGHLIAILWNRILLDHWSDPEDFSHIIS